MAHYDVGPCEPCCGGIVYDCDNCDYDDYPDASVTISGVSTSGLCCGDTYNSTFGLSQGAGPPITDPDTFPDNHPGFDFGVGTALPCDIPNSGNFDCYWRWTGQFCDLACAAVEGFYQMIRLDLRVYKLSNDDWWATLMAGRSAYAIGDPCPVDASASLVWSGYLDPCGKTVELELCDFAFPGMSGCAGSSTVSVTITT